MKNIKLIEVPSEIGAGTRGASLGLEAIKIAALDFMSNFFIHFPSEKVPHENKLLYRSHRIPLCQTHQRHRHDVRPRQQSRERFHKE